MGPRSDSGETLARRLLAAVAAALLLLLVPASSASAAPPPGLVWWASIDGNRVDYATPSAPIKLGAADQARIEVFLDNRGTTPVDVRSVRIEGRVIGMAFFSYTTRLDVALPAGEQTSRRFDIDITDLTHQATGQLPATVSLIAPDRSTVDHVDFTVDVDGSIFSVYGAFGLIVAGITAVVLAGLLVAIWRRQLHRNRWQRGVRFLPAGIGIGLVLTFTLSATRLLTPSPALWLPVLLVCSAGAFLIGYLMPVGKDDTPAAAPDPDATVLQPPTRPWV